jgi:ATP-binding cassette subfamily B protein
MAQVSMVFQDVYLFEDTLMENIRLGRPGASDQEVIEAAARAGVTEIADRLPGGFQTRVGEGGGTLSGGERQRVSIARALLKNAPVVLLDEATAALDIESELLIQRGLARLAGDKTLVVIAHRLQTIRQADLVVVLDGRGGVEAVGDHETLLRTSSTYTRFWAERTESMGWTVTAR